jgi:hypothetical protein
MRAVGQCRLLDRSWGFVWKASSHARYFEFGVISMGKRVILWVLGLRWRLTVVLQTIGLRHGKHYHQASQHQGGLTDLILHSS